MKSEEAYSILDIVSESEGQGVVLTRSRQHMRFFRTPGTGMLFPDSGGYRQEGRHVPGSLQVSPGRHICAQTGCVPQGKVLSGHCRRLFP